MRCSLPQAKILSGLFPARQTRELRVCLDAAASVWDQYGRRGRGVDLAWANRLLLLRADNTLPPAVFKITYPGS